MQARKMIPEERIHCTFRLIGVALPPNRTKETLGDKFISLKLWFSEFKLTLLLIFKQILNIALLIICFVPAHYLISLHV